MQALRAYTAKTTDGWMDDNDKRHQRLMKHELTNYYRSTAKKRYGRLSIFDPPTTVYMHSCHVKCQNCMSNAVPRGPFTTTLTQLGLIPSVNYTQARVNPSDPSTVYHQDRGGQLTIRSKYRPSTARVESTLPAIVSLHREPLKRHASFHEQVFCSVWQ